MFQSKTYTWFLFPSLNRSDTVSEYNSNYSNEVLSTQKDKIAQGYKMKRDWLSMHFLLFQ